MKTLYFTGIGSRQLPTELFDSIIKLSANISEMGFVLRSGGADGADSAFERGVDLVNGKKDIYLPWKNFNQNKSVLFDVSDEATKLAESIHPAWGECSRGAKLLHSRNCYQVLGSELQEPSCFVVAWTPDGKNRGGTRTALVLAQRHNIPIFNLFDDMDNKIEQINDLAERIITLHKAVH